ncbi:hypothetical protein Acr_00g0092930 [Actinidia rufa]|uniref:Retrotransposon Copia-like N-terminal domain-containing protein n=1 Tax=Actinidia rufa TaxID=165716 RepID=A0A7J0DXU5_9ERIC|nr:hypothetical protein Acr_00g0092930 [Actinidia rufa]
MVSEPIRDGLKILQSYTTQTFAEPPYTLQTCAEATSNSLSLCRNPSNPPGLRPEFFFNFAMEESSETSAGSQPQTERGSGTPTIHESSNLRITTTLFNGQNYLSWSRSAILSLKEQGKLGYVNGTITAPPVTDQGYGKWDIKNSHVINRLVHSMVPSIGEGYLHLTMAKDIWDTLADIYSRKGNMAQIFDLKWIIERQNQDEKTVLQYFTSLIGLWQTFDHYQDWNPICAADIASYQKLVERDRIFKFLTGLNQEYDPIRCGVLGMEPLPSLIETFACIQNEESRRMSMLSTVTHDRSALSSTPQYNGWNQPRNSSTDRLPDEKDKLFYDHCQYTRHTRETCWKLNGGRGNRGRGGRFGQSGGRNYGGRGGGSRAHHTEIVDSTTTSDLTPSSLESFSSAKMETLRRFMSRLNTSTSASSSFAYSDTPGRHAGSLMGAGGIVGEAAALDNQVAEIMEEEGEAHAPITQR